MSGGKARSMRPKGKKGSETGSDRKIETGAVGSAGTWAINPVLKTLLMGTTCPSSPLRHLSVRMKLQNINL